MTIVIDPGHGGYDPGAVATLNGKQYRESDITLSVALKVGRMIEKSMPQVNVIYTRASDKHWSTNKTRDLQARVDIANKADASLFLSIHCNAAKATSASGAVTLIMGESSPKRIQQNADVIEDAYRDDLVDMSDAATAAAVRAYIQTVQFTLLQNSNTFANLLQKYHKNAVGHGNRRSLVYGQPLWVLCYTQMPGVLTEIGFMSNKHDLQIMATDAGQQKIAKAIYDGFAEYYKIYFGNEPQPVEEPKVEEPEPAPAEVKKEVKQAEHKPAPAPKKEEAKKEEPKKAEPKKAEPKPAPAPKEQAASDFGYTIQLCASKTRIASNSSEFKSYRGRVREFVTSGTFCYKYCTGIFSSKEEADRKLEEVRKVFKSAYVVGFDGNKLVSQTVVAEKLKNR
ncbi:MAG: N-acetylmuramoyl-L-alanine amidase [Rikenellaceae bacterium]|nr:N-acetylmuramoyl-L-alanine amidase [Rikenellaceae bacterium]